MKNRRRGGGLPRYQRPADPAKNLPNRDLSGETMLERCQSLEALFPEGIPKKELAGFLAEENRRLLQPDGEPKEPETGEMCNALFNRLLDSYEGDLLQLIGRYAPVLLKEVQGNIARLQDSADLTDLQRERARALVDFLLRLDEDRVCWFLQGNGNYDCLELPRTLPEEQREEAYANLEHATVATMKTEGILHLIRSSGVTGGTIVNGFHLTLDRIDGIDVETLERLQRDLPEDSPGNPKGAICQVADVDLP